MKRFLIAAVAALTFGSPAMAQSYGGYGGQTYRGEAHAGLAPEKWRVPLR